jgi:hypothetical protein
MLPPKRHRTTAIELEGDINTPADALRASNAVVKACANGEISSQDASQMMNLIASHIRILDAVEMEARLTALERGIQK